MVTIKEMRALIKQLTDLNGEAATDDMCIYDIGKDFVTLHSDAIDQYMPTVFRFDGETIYCDGDSRW